MHTWDPDRYLQFADERGRPFVDLTARIGAAAPRRVVDLGCGPGTLTALLAQRWPAATVHGVDASAEMIASAAPRPGLTFEVGDLRQWTPPEPVDVLVSNATLQWLPDHLDLLPSLVGHVRPGGWFAVQVPGNHDQPSHIIRHDLATDPAYAAYVAGVARPQAHDAQTYLRALTALGCTVDAWETTYLHQLRGEDPVFDWVCGTGARPTLEALPPTLREEFAQEFRRRLRAAYPPGPDGAVTLPFRRIFVVATTPGLS